MHSSISTLNMSPQIHHSSGGKVAQGARLTDMLMLGLSMVAEFALGIGHKCADGTLKDRDVRHFIMNTHLVVGQCHVRAEFTPEKFVWMGELHVSSDVAYKYVLAAVETSDGRLIV